MNLKLFSKILNKQALFLVGVILFFIPFFWFSNTEFLSGGELFVIIVPEKIFALISNAWQSTSFGLPSIYINSCLYQACTYVLSMVFSSVVTLKIILGFFLSGAYFSFHFLLRNLLEENSETFLIPASLFYVFNPFYIMMFSWLPTYGFLFVFFPVLFLQIINIFKKRSLLKAYPLLIITSFFISAASLNLALFGLIFFTVGVYYLFLLILDIKCFFPLTKKLLVIVFLIILSNIFWILPLASNQKDLFGNAKIYKQSLSADSLFKSPILNGLTLNEYFWANKKDSNGDLYYSYSEWYQFTSKVILIGIIILIIIFFIIKNSSKINIKKKSKKLFLFFFILFLLGVFLSKGSASPCGFLYKYLLENNKVFGIYRASDIKFPFIAVFGLSFLIFFIFHFFHLRKKFFLKYFYLLFIASIIFLGSPFILGEIFNNSAKSIIPKYWFEYALKEDLNKLDYRVLLFPKNFLPFDNYSWGYKGAWLSNNISNRANIGYTEGYGPSIQESFFSSSQIIYRNFEVNDSFSMAKSMSLFNVRKVLQRNDFDLNKNSSNKMSYQKKNVYLYKNKEIKKFFRENDLYFHPSVDYVDLNMYELADEYYLPHFYTSKNNIISSRTIDSLSKIIADPNWKIRSAVFFENQNDGKDEILKQVQDDSDENLPIIEFKKINPTKYRVRVHSADGKFPLIFSESFHDGWKAYLTKSSLDSRFRGNDRLEKYKILDGNDGDQASKEKLQKFIQNGWVSDLGDGKEKVTEHNKWENNKEKLDYVEKYNIDFVSKNFQDTIQNDNLPNGYFWETWLQKPIENNNNHLMVNGYANAWMIDVDEVCGLDSRRSLCSQSGCGNNNVVCIKNQDGSYDFEMVIEFWPQRLFYIGLGVSGLTLLGCLIYLGYDWRKRKRIDIENT